MPSMAEPAGFGCCFIAGIVVGLAKVTANKIRRKKD